jgi:hypothetical protein
VGTEDTILGPHSRVVHRDCEDDMHAHGPERDTIEIDPADLVRHLRMGADRAERIARAAATHGLFPWHAEPCDDFATGQCACIVAYDTLEPMLAGASPYVAHAETPQLAEYIAMLPPVVIVMLAHILRQVAHEIESYDEYHQLSPGFRRALEKRAVLAGELAGYFLRSST